MSTEKKKAANAKWRAANKAHIAAYNAAYNSSHAEQIAAWHAKPEHKADQLARCRVYAKKNRQKVREVGRRFKARNPGYNTAHAHKHKQAKRNARPRWANDFFIAEAYSLARLRSLMTGIEWSVDHIVPLRSKLVCGLHCEQNLAVVPSIANKAKGNRVWPFMPDIVLRGQSITDNPSQQLRRET